MKTLRETPLYIATPSPRGIRITIKRSRHHPKTRVITRSLWDQINREPDSIFDATCVLELGIGVFARP